jgi:HAD superfamily hydrolase (TIGR01549 family)
MNKTNNWAVLFDLDETLVLTSSLEALRRTRKWAEAYKGFPKTVLPPGTLEFIDKITPKAQLGVVTKAPRAYAEKLLAFHKIKVPVIVAFHDVRKVKPDPEALLLASQRLAIESANSIYVGDDVSDVQAARAAQFTPIGVCWGERFDIGLETICTNWDDVYNQIMQVISR